MAKKTRWLYKKEAELLGLKPKENEGKRPNARYSITKEQWSSILDLRDFELKSKTNTNDYSKNSIVMSAWDSDGVMMDIDSYCENYGLPRTDITSYKLITHTGTPHYNIVFKELSDIDNIDYKLIKDILKSEISKKYKHNKQEFKRSNEAVLKWADLHFGAHIRNLIKTKDYDSNILIKGLLRSVSETNDFGFKKVHVHINGDLIESFSGLNHVNSWMSMDKNQVGANAVKLCVKLLHESLSKIKNLGKILIVSGNHDRTSKANDEDVKGDAANLIAWGLELMGYDVEFNSLITTQLVDGINHINLHGDKGLSKRATKDIIWDYGIQGKFNFVFEAHLHSIIEKLSLSQRNNFKTIKDDSLDHRRMHLPPFFTGNYYSETLNFFSNSGYTLVWDNGKGVPNVFLGSV